jgi:tellurite resistance protein TerC
MSGAPGSGTKRMKTIITRFRQLLRQPPLRLARKIVIAVLGGTVVLVGIAMVVLPGPAVLVIPLGLAILGTEFLWAKRWLKRARALLPSGGRSPPPVTVR